MKLKTSSCAVSPILPATLSGDVASENVEAQAGVDEGPQGDGGELVEPAELEVQSRVSIPSPEAPTASDLAEHRDGSHMPYRSWCDECVEWFGRDKH